MLSQFEVEIVQELTATRTIVAENEEKAVELVRDALLKETVDGYELETVAVFARKKNNVIQMPIKNACQR